MTLPAPSLDGYLERIGYRGPVAPTFDCLTAIHRCQALAVPYENLDVQLGIPLGHDIAQIYDKIVRRRRGGWCYETNGLLHWALGAIGFEVAPVTGGVLRRERGDSALGNHVLMLVRLGRSWIADLGLGDGIRDPIPLEAGIHRQGGLTYRLERLPDGYWRYHNHQFAFPEDFDFRDAPPDEAVIAAKRQYLETAADSTFVLNLVCQIMEDEAITCLTGRVLRRKTAGGTEKRLIGSAVELAEVVAQVFGITGVDVAALWPKVAARHEALFSGRGLDEIEVAGM